MQRQDIEFRIGEQPEAVGFRLAGCRTLHDVLEGLQRAFEVTPLARPVTVVLTPPVAPALSIPKAFKVLIGLMTARHEPRRVEVHLASAEILDHLERYLTPVDEAGASFPLGRLRLDFVVADIVDVRADAIVNASNPTLTLGGGVSGAIRLAAEAGLQAELNRIAAKRKLRDGDVVMTEGFGLPHARRIVHAVTERGTPEVVAAVVRRALEICEQERLATVAIPALTTGTRHLPIEGFVAGLDLGLRRHLEDHPSGSLSRIVLVAWKRSDYDELVAHWSAIRRV